MPALTSRDASRAISLPSRSSLPLTYRPSAVSQTPEEAAEAERNLRERPPDTWTERGSARLLTTAELRAANALAVERDSVGFTDEAVRCGFDALSFGRFPRAGLAGMWPYSTATSRNGASRTFG